MWDIDWVSPQDTDQCLWVAISFYRHCSLLVPCENGSVETTVAEGGQNPVARSWGCTLGGNWPPEPISSYASINFWCKLVASPATAASWMSVVEVRLYYRKLWLAMLILPWYICVMQVSRHRDYSARQVYEAEHGVCQLCQFDAETFYKRLR